ncbi:hypothetical protein GGR50DRAFT_34134 [Xylaria sp. CBS 124048]|nr:hypothetical protein GGR50DRAFT_34134 [Xylaria sp. CBS 124048]
MADSDDLDLPIALRRAPRRRANARTAALPAGLETPHRTPSRKRVRFSGSGFDSPRHDVAGPSSSTGLTPMIKRSYVSEPVTKRRRIPAAATAAARRRALNTDLETEESMDDVDILALPSLPSNTNDREMRRARRYQSRLRVVEVAKKGRPTTKSRTRKENETIAADVEAEVQRLRSELEARDAEIARLHNETLVHDTDRILELEQQIQILRAELAKQQAATAVANEGDDSDNDEKDGKDSRSRSFYNWTLAARDPFSENFLDRSEDIRDITMADVISSTPSRRRNNAKATPAGRSVSASFPTPPSTSPTQPATPCSARRTVMPVTPQSHVGIQVELPDPEKEVLKAELGSLRSELGKLTATLECHATQQTQLSAKLSNALTSSSSSPTTIESNNTRTPDLEANLEELLKLLSDRTTSLNDLNNSITTLGFPGTTTTEMLSSITTGLRAARLELEYLTPGSISLPLTSHGAEVLDLVLARLRSLARKSRADEDAIEEYRAIELSLREQLTTLTSHSASDVDAISALRSRDARIAELESDLETLRSAAEGYRRDVSELETRVLRLRDDGVAAMTSLEADLASSRAQMARGGAAVEELEGRVRDARALATELAAKLKDVQRRREVESRVRNRSAGAALALRDARVLELRREVAGVSDSLRGAQATIVKLRVENSTLTRRAEEAESERKEAKEAVLKMKAEMEAELSSVRRRRSVSGTPEPRAGSFLSADLARSGGRGRSTGKRRRGDSGLGFLEEEDDDGM